MAYILFVRDSSDRREQAWVLLGTAQKLALSVSLSLRSCIRQVHGMTIIIPYNLRWAYVSAFATLLIEAFNPLS